MYSFDSTLHAHTLNGKPLIGTTTLIKEMFPPPLAWWASGKALEPLGWKNPKQTTPEDRRLRLGAVLSEIKAYTVEDWDTKLQECYRNHDTVKKEAGESGTNIHELIERIIKDAIEKWGGVVGEVGNEDPSVAEFIKWAQGKKFIHSEAHVYSELLWLGGIVDFVFKTDEGVYLGDIKTSKGIYPSHFIQLGLYDCEQSENGFFASDGMKEGESEDVVGYTVINLPKEGGINVKTYRDTKRMKTFSTTLVEAYKTKKTLEAICQK